MHEDGWYYGDSREYIIDRAREIKKEQETFSKKHTAEVKARKIAAALGQIEKYKAIKIAEIIEDEETLAEIIEDVTAGDKESLEQKLKHLNAKIASESIIETIERFADVATEEEEEISDAVVALENVISKAIAQASIALETIVAGTATSEIEVIRALAKAVIAKRTKTESISALESETTAIEVANTAITTENLIESISAVIVATQRKEEEEEIKEIESTLEKMITTTTISEEDGAVVALRKAIAARNADKINAIGIIIAALAKPIAEIITIDGEIAESMEDTIAVSLYNEIIGTMTLRKETCILLVIIIVLLIVEQPKRVKDVTRALKIATKKIAEIAKAKEKSACEFAPTLGSQCDAEEAGGEQIENSNSKGRKTKQRSKWIIKQIEDGLPNKQIYDKWNKMVYKDRSDIAGNKDDAERFKDTAIIARVRRDLKNSGK